MATIPISEPEQRSLVSIRARISRYDELANAPFVGGYPTKESIAVLREEMLFQRGVQSYLWALPALNMFAMKEGSERAFGSGYNVLPIWKRRLNAKTLVTTPNSDVIYAMGYLDLKKDGPIVIEVPPGLQGILDDFFQRPLRSEGEINGRRWAGDVGLSGPDKGRGGKYLVLPPDFHEKTPKHYFTFRSRTYGVFVFWRGFFQDPQQLEAPVKVMEQTRIYRLGKESTPKTMHFPDASGVPVNMLFPRDSSAFDMLSRFIDSESVDPADMDMRGMLAAIGIMKGQPFSPDMHTRMILDRAARCAGRVGRAVPLDVTANMPGGKYYKDRRYINGFPPGITPEFAAPALSPTYTHLETRSGFFTEAYSASPAMALNLPGAGAKYPCAFQDSDGDYLIGDCSYRIHLPAGIPVKLFWSVTIYDAETASGLDNGQAFPSINAMDKPITNSDGSIDIYLAAKSPGSGRNWLATVPGVGFFVMLRLYGPTQAFYDQTWKPSDVEKVRSSVATNL
jgi:hypothetical protein